MKYSLRLLRSSVLAAVVFFSIEFAQAEQWWAIPFLFLLGSLWLIWERSQKHYGDFLFSGFVLASLLGVSSGLTLVWSITGIVAALTAWDLDHFLSRVRNVARAENLQEMEKHHLVKLFTVNGFGLLLALVASIWNIRIQFGWVFFLVLITVILFNQLVVILKNAG